MHSLYPKQNDLDQLHKKMYIINKYWTVFVFGITQCRYLYDIQRLWGFVFNYFIKATIHKSTFNMQFYSNGNRCTREK